MKTYSRKYDNRAGKANPPPPPSLNTGDFADLFIDNSKSTRNRVLTFHVICCISHSHAYVFLDCLKPDKNTLQNKKILHAFLRK